jgi:hypothetical protein
VPAPTPGLQPFASAPPSPSPWRDTNSTHSRMAVTAPGLRWPLLFLCSLCVCVGVECWGSVTRPPLWVRCVLYLCVCVPKLQSLACYGNGSAAATRQQAPARSGCVCVCVCVCACVSLHRSLYNHAAKPRSTCMLRDRPQVIAPHVCVNVCAKDVLPLSFDPSCPYYRRRCSSGGCVTQLTRDTGPETAHSCVAHQRGSLRPTFTVQPCRKPPASWPAGLSIAFAAHDKN